MKSFAVLALAAAASAATTVFEVSNFSAGCVRHSTQCVVNFGVIQSGNGESTPVECKGSASSTDGNIPSIKEGTCEGSSRTWSLERGADGLTLTVSQQVSAASSQSASHLIKSSELEKSTDPNASVESYTGATDFPLQN